MTTYDIIAILALTGYAVYRQTRVNQVRGAGRFKLALIYGIVGICVGGFNWPSGAAGIGLVLISLALSAVVGLWRGKLTRMWVGDDGQIMTQGTVVTVGLFLGMIVVKFGIGAWASIAHIDNGEGFGEVLVMIAIMVAIQAELVWRRAQKLAATTDRPLTATVSA
jgi:hypothetical protein